jgi:glycerol-3-phosphate dehydrogenase
VVPRERLPLDDTSVIMPSKQGDGRSMFAIAWGRQTILGTTDTAYTGALDELALTQDDLDYVLAAGNAVFDRGLTEDDVVAAWVGVRPLMRQPGGSGDAGAMSDISRRHVVLDDASGLVTVTGGKLTTYRRMAADTVDVLVARDDRRARSRTDEISLGCRRPLGDVVADTVAAAATLGIGEETAKLLVRGHGEAAVDVLSLVAANPAYGTVLAPEAPYLMAEVAYAAQREGAATLDDVLSRRTRVALRVRDAGLPMARQAAGIIATTLDRSDEWIEAQVAAYVEAVGRERGPLGHPRVAEARS